MMLDLIGGTVMTRGSKIGFALLVAFLAGFSGTAQATSFNLGNVSGPSVLSVGNGKDVGPFTDNYYFTINPGLSLVFSALVTDETWRHGGIYDMDGTLSDSSGIVQNGDATTSDFPPPYPVRSVNFMTTLLGPGVYKLSIFGNSESDVGVW